MVRQDTEALQQPGKHPTQSSLQTVPAGLVPAADRSPAHDMLTLPGAAQEQARGEVDSPPTATGNPHPGGKEPGRTAPASPVTAKAILEAKSMWDAGKPHPATGGPAPAPAQGPSAPPQGARQLTPPVAPGPTKARHLSRVA